MLIFNGIPTGIKGKYYSLYGAYIGFCNTRESGLEILSSDPTMKTFSAWNDYLGKYVNLADLKSGSIKAKDVYLFDFKDGKLTEVRYFETIKDPYLID
jgi:hypothetical protein